MQEIMLFYLREDKTNYYIKESKKIPNSDNILNISTLFTSEMINYESIIVDDLEKIQKSTDGGIAYNLICIDKLPDDICAINFYTLDNVEDSLIPCDILIHMVKEWIRLKKQQVQYILIENNNGSWGLRGGNDKEALLNS